MIAMKNNLVISSTKFKHPRKHKVTWALPDQNTNTNSPCIALKDEIVIIHIRTYIIEELEHVQIIVWL